MNYKEINTRLKRIAKDKGRVYFEILYLFLMERFLARLSKSKHTNNFVLKGGFLMIKRWAPYSRTTRDLDFVVQSINKDEIVQILEEICKIDLKDGIKYTYQSQSPIMTGASEEGSRRAVRSDSAVRHTQLAWVRPEALATGSE